METRYCPNCGKPAPCGNGPCAEAERLRALATAYREERDATQAENARLRDAAERAMQAITDQRLGMAWEHLRAALAPAAPPHEGGEG